MSNRTFRCETGYCFTDRPSWMHRYLDTSSQFWPLHFPITGLRASCEATLISSSCANLWRRNILRGQQRPDAAIMIDTVLMGLLSGTLSYWMTTDNVKALLSCFLFGYNPELFLLCVPYAVILFWSMHNFFFRESCLVSAPSYTTQQGFGIIKVNRFLKWIQLFWFKNWAKKKVSQFCTLNCIPK